MAMTQTSPSNLGVEIPAPPPQAPDVGAPFPYPPKNLLESDGEPLESDWHVLQIGLLREVVNYHFRDRDDYYVGGNMFIYFNEEQARDRDYRGPDFFFVNGGVSHTPLRPYWAIWSEKGRYPDVIIELLSPSTRKGDLTTKKDLYEKTFNTRNYFCYDPDNQELLGWYLSGVYHPIETNEKGWLWSDQLGLWVGTWNGSFERQTAVWLRFYDSSGNLVPTSREAEKQRADAEKQRADALQAELAQLKAQPASPTNPPS
jgi:Uma2 family endonuclease